MNTEACRRHIARGEKQIEEAYGVLDRGVSGVISEEIALACTIKRLDYAIQDMDNARRRMKRRLRDIDDHREDADV